MFCQVEFYSGSSLGIIMVVSFHPVVCPVILAWWAGAKLTIAKSAKPSGMVFSNIIYSHSNVQRSVCVQVFMYIRRN